MHRRIIAAAAIGVLGIAAACSPAEQRSGGGGGGGGGDAVTVTFRLWDESVANAYEESFDAFEAENDDIEVEIELVPWDNYWEALPQDIGGGTMADIYWTNTSNFGRYADNGNLIDIGAELGDQVDDWQSAVVELYTRDGKQWGIPQLWDSIALYYNADLLAEAGVDPGDLGNLEWRTDGADTFLPVAQQLTLDSDGNAAGSADFDAGDIVQYGFNSELDGQSIYWNFIGGIGGTWQDGDEFSMGDDPNTALAFEYLIDLVEEFNVAPPAADTVGTGGERTRDMFLQGRLALYQSGPYRLTAIDEGADFDWGIAPLLQGPEGRVSVVNGIVAVGNADTEHVDETLRVLSWLGTAEGQRPIAEGGYAFPGIEEVESEFVDYWADQGVDIQPFVEAAAGEAFPPPVGPRVQAGTNALQDTLGEMFLGRKPVEEALAEAQELGNAAMED